MTLLITDSKLCGNTPLVSVTGLDTFSELHNQYRIARYPVFTAEIELIC
jgi:hypothetical protein